MMVILKFLLNWVSGPIFDKILQGYQAKLQSDTDQTKIAAGLAARELSVQQAQIEAQNALKVAEIGHFWEPEKLAFYVTLAYYTKILVWDVMLGWGSTDALHGQVATWAQMIMGFYFGQRTFENVARILKRKMS